VEYTNLFLAIAVQCCARTIKMQYDKKRKSSVKLIKLYEKIINKQNSPPTYHTPISKERKKKLKRRL
jgi:hypothetical protein